MKSATAISLGLSIIAAACLGSGCETSTKVTWQDNGVPRHEHPDQDWWSYKFIYHPNAQVYFEPYSKQYFWFEDGVWKQSDSSPRELPLDRRLAKVVKLQNDLPYKQHDMVLAWQPCYRAIPARFDPTLHKDAAVRFAEHKE